jgi:hypothetical protein
MPENDARAGRLPAANVDIHAPVGGIDPDFYVPVDRDRTAGRFARWLRRLPVFGR